MSLTRRPQRSVTMHCRKTHRHAPPSSSRLPVSRGLPCRGPSRRRPPRRRGIRQPDRPPRSEPVVLMETSTRRPRPERLPHRRRHLARPASRCGRPVGQRHDGDKPLDRPALRRQTARLPPTGPLAGEIPRSGRQRIALERNGPFRNRPARHRGLERPVDPHGRGLRGPRRRAGGDCESDLWRAGRSWAIGRSNGKVEPARRVRNRRGHRRQCPRRPRSRIRRAQGTQSLRDARRQHGGNAHPGRPGL